MMRGIYIFMFASINCKINDSINSLYYRVNISDQPCRPDKEDGDVPLTREAPVDMLLVLLWKP